MNSPVKKTTISSSLNIVFPTFTLLSLRQFKERYWYDSVMAVSRCSSCKKSHIKRKITLNHARQISLMLKRSHQSINQFKAFQTFLCQRPKNHKYQRYVVPIRSCTTLQHPACDIVLSIMYNSLFIASSIIDNGLSTMHQSSASWTVSALLVIACTTSEG